MDFDAWLEKPYQDRYARERDREYRTVYIVQGQERAKSGPVDEWSSWAEEECDDMVKAQAIKAKLEAEWPGDDEYETRVVILEEEREVEVDDDDYPDEDSAPGGHDDY